VKRLIRALGLWLVYASLALMGLWLLAVGGDSLRVAGDIGPFALWGGFLAGAAFAVVGVLYEVRSDGAERLRRHRQTQNASVVILIAAVLVWIGWAVMPALVRVAAGGAGAGYFLGFVAVFIPNRSRGIAIRNIPDDAADSNQEAAR
jgi:hypothetical protein